MFRNDDDHPFVLGADADMRHAMTASWFSSEPGATLVAAEQAALRERLVDRFGYHLVQVGDLPGLDALGASRILHRWVVDLGTGGGEPGLPLVRGRSAALPFDSDSVDVVVMPHVLEFEPRPHEALREAARVLLQDGHLFVSVLNPWSLMGLWRRVLRRSGNPPWDARFLAQGRLRDWLELLGLELLTVDAFFFRPPVSSARLLHKLRLMETVGARVWPRLAGAYLMSARRRVSRATPVRPRFSYRPRLVGVSLAGPPARMSDRD